MKPRLEMDEFVARSVQVHGDAYDYSRVEYAGAKSKVEIICKRHGPFMQAPAQHMLGYGCPECAKEKRKVTMLARHGVEFASQSKDMQAKSRATREAKFGSMKPPGSGRKAMGVEEFVRRAREVHGDKYDYSRAEYVNNSAKIEIVCPEHGPFMQAPAKHLLGQGCPHYECRRARWEASGHLDGQLEAFLEKAREIHGDKYDYSGVEWHGAKRKISIVCPEHGVFMQTPEKHLSGNGCPHRDCVHGVRESRSMEKHGVRWPSQAESVKDKVRETSMDRYGTMNIMSSEDGKARMRDACLEKFGTESPLGSPEIRAKLEQTMEARYGGRGAMADPAVKAKATASNMERFGVPNPMMAESVRDKVRASVMERYGTDNPMKDLEVVRKMVDGRIEAGTINSSESEDVLYHMLCERFGEDDVVRQYASDVYPWACDFYVRSRNLYCELNASWTHGGHWYGWNADDDKVLKAWLRKGKSNPYYGSALKTWTDLDVRKRSAARGAGLNYIVFWDDKLGDAAVWFALDCPDGRDWEREYSWLSERKLGMDPPVRPSLSMVAKAYQFDAFYHRELAIWDADRPFRKWPSIRMFLYANRLRYLGKGPAELSDREILQAFAISGILRSYTVFDVYAMDLAVKKYGISSIYDPCAGWGERMLYCYYDHIAYEGHDVNPALASGYARMMADLGMADQSFALCDSAETGPSREAMAVVTCPPYGDTEIYSPDGAENLEPAAFLDWWRRVVDRSLVCRPSYFCFQVNRKWRDAMLAVVKAAGFELADEIFCRKKSSHLTRGKDGTDHKKEFESMLVLKKA